jgi:hypothetical protein
MENERSESELEAKGMWHDYSRITEMWEFKGSTEEPDMNEFGALSKVKDRLTDEEGSGCVSEQQLRELGFEKKEQVGQEA